jgi:hypothetical protein
MNLHDLFPDALASAMPIIIAGIMPLIIMWVMITIILKFFLPTEEAKPALGDNEQSEPHKKN